jgi:hypothetical protein
MRVSFDTAMQEHTELGVVRLALEPSRCSFTSCKEHASAEFDAQPLCAEHFLSVAVRELELRIDELKAKCFEPSAMDSCRKLLADCAQEARRLAEDELITDPATKTRLLDLLLQVSNLNQHLRRSPRVAASVPVFLRREEAGQTWEEETWISTASHHGAGMACRHLVEKGGTVILCRKDRGTRVRARVIYCRFDSQGRREIGVELLDPVEFWDNSPKPRRTGPVPRVTV